jgi:predicted RNA-binding Zn-ribbon protein involved in translation (DUF1610 family)
MSKPKKDKPKEYYYLCLNCGTQLFSTDNNLNIRCPKCGTLMDVASYED